MKKIVSLMLVCIILFTSCVTSTQVTFQASANGEDIDGASVYIDDELVGETPVTVKMSNIVTDEPKILIEKDGYDGVSGQVKKEVKVINLITGFFVFVPWLWVYGPKKIQTFRLREGY